MKGQYRAKPLVYINGTCDGYSERKYASSEVETGDTLF